MTIIELVNLLIIQEQWTFNELFILQINAVTMNIVELDTCFCEKISMSEIFKML